MRMLGKIPGGTFSKSRQTDGSVSSQRINSKPVTDRINKPLMRIGSTNLNDVALPC